MSPATRLGLGFALDPAYPQRRRARLWPGPDPAFGQPCPFRSPRCAYFDPDRLVRRRRRAMAPEKGIAIVTGAGSGIGAAAATALAAEAWHVVVVGRRPVPRDQLVHDNPELRLDAVPTDVTDEES